MGRLYYNPANPIGRLYYQMLNLIGRLVHIPEVDVGLPVGASQLASSVVDGGGGAGVVVVEVVWRLRSKQDGRHE